MKIQLFPIDELKAYDNNPRRIPEEAVKVVSNSIREFGFKVPVIIDKDSVIVAGHTRVLAARELGLEKVPCIVADDLTPEQIRAFRLVDNKTSELTGWDFEMLDSELEGLDIDMSQFGFEIDDMNFTAEDFFSKQDSCQEVTHPQKHIITCPNCGAQIDLDEE